jgi:hypothetical protein
MTAQKLISQLSILEENIIAEAARMAIWFAKAAQYRVEMMRRRCRAEAALDECAATLNLRYRARQTGERKTEAYFKARITLNPKHKRLLKEKEEADYREELSKLVLDSYRMRRDAIKIVADHQGYSVMKGESMIERGNQERRLRNRARSLDRKRRGKGD